MNNEPFDLPTYLHMTTDEFMTCLFLLAVVLFVIQRKVSRN